MGKLEHETRRIDSRRQTQLDALARVVADLLREGPVPMTFLCTHNSRRSHLSQVLAQAAARAHGIDEVVTYSGGTEVTACHPNTIAALERAGFEVVQQDATENPVYLVRAWDGGLASLCFSKRYDDPVNPREGFVAVLTCSSADAECPCLLGAAHRVAILYDDPKAFDGTPREAEAYDECCARISREMHYLFRRVAELRD